MEDHAADAPGPAVQTLTPLITAAEAYPAFERLFLEAETEVWAGFRIFDLDTRLRSAEARKIGETWFDLVVHTLDRGVDITLALSDFDAVAATPLHRQSWAAARRFAAAAELGGPGRLHFRLLAHPARVGIVPKTLFRGKLRARLREMGDADDTPTLRQIDDVGDVDLIPASHHQKLAVFDRRTLYIGGLDLDERRFDAPTHRRPAEETWHDVQAFATGPVGAAAQAHLETFADGTLGTAAPRPPQPGFLRTLSAARQWGAFHISPQTKVTEIEEAHLNAIARAEDLIYAETQFFRQLPLAKALAAAAARSAAPPHGRTERMTAAGAPPGRGRRSSISTPKSVFLTRGRRSYPRPI